MAVDERETKTKSGAIKTATQATTVTAAIVPPLTIASVDSVVNAAQNDVKTLKTSKAKEGTKRYPPWLEHAIFNSVHSQKVWGSPETSASSSTGGDAKVGSPVSRIATTSTNTTTSTKATTGSSTTPTPTNNQIDKTNHEIGILECKTTNVFEAARRNDAESMRGFIEVLGARVFKHDDHFAAGATVLHEACENGSLDIVRQLLGFADDRLGYGFCTEIVNEVDSVYSGTTPLIAVCRGLNGFISSRLEILRLLLKYEAIVESVDGHGDNALHWCARHSRLPLLRVLLKETDAAAHAIFMENYRMEKPLDIAKKVVVRKHSMETMNVYNLLRTFDANCNVRLKIQVVKRLQGNRRNEMTVKDQVDAQIAIEQADNTVNTTQMFLHEVLVQAEALRRQKRQEYIESKAQEALVNAKEFLESREGKKYANQRLTYVLEEVKNELSVKSPTGGSLKTKDLRKAANDRIEDTYYAEKQQEAKEKAHKAFETKHPPYPSATDWRKLGELA